MDRKATVVILEKYEETIFHFPRRGAHSFSDWHTTPHATSTSTPRCRPLLSAGPAIAEWSYRASRNTNRHNFGAQAGPRASSLHVPVATASASSTSWAAHATEVPLGVTGDVSHHENKLCSDCSGALIARRGPADWTAYAICGACHSFLPLYGHLDGPLDSRWREMHRRPPLTEPLTTSDPSRDLH